MSAIVHFDDAKKISSIGIRHLQSVLLFIAMLCNCCMKVNMSLAVVAMSDVSKDNTFNWSTSTKNTILSSFTWGFVITLVPAGELAARFGGMPLVTISVAANSVMTLLLPTVAHYGWKYVCACRVIQGFFQGLLSPAVHNLLSKWVPVDESHLGAFIYAGGLLGNAIQLMSSGYIAEFWGWPAIFYMDGILGVAWTIAYLIFGSSSPQASKIISIGEQMHIQNSLNHSEKKKLKTPWFHLLTSVPVLVSIITLSGAVWVHYTLLTQLPTYFKHVLHVNIKQNGIISAIPYVAGFVMAFVFGYLFDFLLKKKWTSKTASRKLANSFATFVPSLALLILAHAPANITLIVALLCVAVSFYSCVFSGISLVKLDIAPNFAGTITGVAQLAAYLLALCAPFVASAVVTDETNPRDWRTLFYISAAISTATNIIYLIFGTSEKQKWNDPVEESSTTLSEKNKV